MAPLLCPLVWYPKPLQFLLSPTFCWDLNNHLAFSPTNTPGWPVLCSSATEWPYFSGHPWSLSKSIWTQSLASPACLPNVVRVFQLASSWSHNKTACLQTPAQTAAFCRTQFKQYQIQPQLHIQTEKLQMRRFAFIDHISTQTTFVLATTTPKLPEFLVSSPPFTVFYLFWSHQQHKLTIKDHTQLINTYWPMTARYFQYHT